MDFQAGRFGQTNEWDEYPNLKCLYTFEMPPKVRHLWGHFILQPLKTF